MPRDAPNPSFRDQATARRHSCERYNALDIMVKADSDHSDSGDDGAYVEHHSVRGLSRCSSLLS